MKVYAANAANDIANGTGSELVRLVELIITKIPLWIAAVIVAFLAVVAAKIVRKIVENKLAEKGLDEDHQELQILGGRVSYVVVLTVGVTVALKIAGIDLTTILAAVAFGIGFALKDLIMNFLAGMMILISRHFAIGDYISIEGVIGKVVEIQSRTTILQAIDGTKVIMPNAKLFKEKVISFTSNPFRRIEFIVGVDFRTNLENAVRVLMKAVRETEGVLAQPHPAVLVSEFSDSSINLKVRAWVESRGGWLKVKSDLAVSIKRELDAHGITIPWPIRTVVYDKDQEMVEKIMAEEKTQSATASAQPAATPQQNTVITSQIPVSQFDDQPLQPLAEQRISTDQ